MIVIEKLTVSYLAKEPFKESKVSLLNSKQNAIEFILSQLNPVQIHVFYF